MSREISQDVLNKINSDIQKAEIELFRFTMKCEYFQNLAIKNRLLYKEVLAGYLSEKELEQKKQADEFLRDFEEFVVR